MDQIESLDQLQNEVKVEEVNILFLDVSSTCTGYSIYRLNFHTKTAILQKAGALWMNQDWQHAEKYSYMFHAVSNYFWVVEQVDYIVTEQYSINPKRMSGVMTVPEMLGSIKTAAWENGIKVSSILPQQWRSKLGIKATVTNGEKDWKEPTKQKVLTLANVPEDTVSNITGQLRKSPSDLYDSIAIGWGWLIKFGIKSVQVSPNVKFNDHIGVISNKGGA